MGEFDPVKSGQPFKPNAAAHNLFLQTAKIVASKEYAKRDPASDAPYVWFWGKLTSSLSAGSFASPTTCTVDVWEVDESSGSDPKPLIVTTQTDLLGITIVNYDASLTGTSGTICKVERDFRGKWSLKWIGC